MPRISPRLIKEALQHSPLLPHLLRASPYIESAKQELRWIKNELPRSRWLDAVRRRSQLEPLQYILKSQPFGPLDIICRKGVLIPRWETEEWVTKLSQILVKSGIHDISVLDACTGTGCIPMLMNHILNEQNTMKSKICAFDVSTDAYNLATENQQVYESLYPNSAKWVSLQKADLFSKKLGQILGETSFDLLVSNPPYIPQQDYESSMAANGVEKSVRIYEPALALVGENEFYQALLDIVVTSMKVSGFVFELGYQTQVDYVASKLPSTTWDIRSMHDGASKLRCVVGWKKGSVMQCLSELC